MRLSESDIGSLKSLSDERGSSRVAAEIGISSEDLARVKSGKRISKELWLLVQSALSDNIFTRLA
jgi:hypothetical protein